jgi:hypothetical protein
MEDEQTKLLKNPKPGPLVIRFTDDGSAANGDVIREGRPCQRHHADAEREPENNLADGPTVPFGVRANSGRASASRLVRRAERRTEMEARRADRERLESVSVLTGALDRGCEGFGGCGTTHTVSIRPSHAGGAVLAAHPAPGLHYPLYRVLFLLSGCAMNLASAATPPGRPGL